MKEFWDRLTKKCQHDIEEANKHMDVEQLTDDQKFAICFFAGVDVSMKQNESGGYYPVTAPSSVQIIDGKWHVTTKADRIKAESSYLDPHHPNARGNQGIYG